MADSASTTNRVSNWSDSRSYALLSPPRIALIYFGMGVTWIVFSDQVVTSIAPTPNAVTIMQTVKGWLFVLLSSLLIYALVAAHHRQLDQTNTRLKRATRQVSVLQRILRHNLRNICNVIAGNVQCVETECENVPQERFKIIDAHIDRLLELGQKSGHFRGPDTSPQPICLNDVVNRVTTSLEESYPTALIKTTLPEDVVVVADPRLDFAIHELLENGIKHNNTTPPVVALAVTDSSTNEYTITIRDNGPGLPQVEQDVLGVTEESQLHHSLGIGLGLAEMIVTTSGGSLDHDDTYTDGTAFHLQLPKCSRTTSVISELGQ